MTEGYALWLTEKEIQELIEVLDHSKYPYALSLPDTNHILIKLMELKTYIKGG